MSLAASPVPALDLVDPAGFERLLRDHVRDGLVDYKALLGQRKELDDYLDSMAGLAGSLLGEASSDQRLAFYLNAYNALTLRTVLDHYPIPEKGGGSLLKGLGSPRNSIRRIPGVWDKTRHRLSGKDLTLDDVEHEILRPEFQDPRIHFALVCAAKSCPKLRSEAYHAGDLQGQLQDDVRRFALDQERLAVDAGSGRVRVSRILKWYEQDFEVLTAAAPKNPGLGKGLGQALALLAIHLPADLRRFLMEDDYKVEFLDYDWALNEP